jgi:periplasmic divalent cation tolerance protein
VAALVVITTLPDPVLAEELARVLIDQRLSACVSILGPCQSVYRWQGLIQASSEVPLLIKTTDEAYPALEQEIKRRHPYELPEIIAIPVVGGLPAYLDWVAAEANPGACSI